MSDLILVGAGGMARDYLKVLNALGVKPTVVGRDLRRAAALAAETGVEVHPGGMQAWLAGNPAPSRAIVATGVEALEVSAQLLIAHGCRTILVEKPGALNGGGVRRLAELAGRLEADLWIGFNRRYYASVAAARQLIAKDGGATSAFFDFTELGFRIAGLEKAVGVKEHWFLGNSLHVVDLAFHLIGQPRELTTRVAGALPWHSRAACFAGCGTTIGDTSFAYRADWAAPGRWRIELYTPNHALILSPLEQLRVQKLGTFEQRDEPLEDRLDKEFKPGLYRQVEAWLNDDRSLTCTIADLAAAMDHYEAIGGYASKAGRS